MNQEPIINSILGIGYPRMAISEERKREILRPFGCNAFSDKPQREFNNRLCDYGSVTQYVEKVLPEVKQVFFSQPCDGEITDYHLDKAVQYHYEWEEAGCDVRRASMIYLFTYTKYFGKTEKPLSKQWVIENYDLFSWALRVIEVRLGMLSPEGDGKLERCVVAACNRMRTPDGLYVPLIAARHFSPGMHLQLDFIEKQLEFQHGRVVALNMREEMEEGFIDQWDEFLTRHEAYVVARITGQSYSRRPKSGNLGEAWLWSEDIH